MHATTVTTLPLSYSKACDTFRPRIGQSTAIRTGLGGKSFVNFFKPCAMLNSLVRQLISEGRPACIHNRLRHAGFGKSGGADISYRDVIKLPNDASREFVVKIISAILDLRMNRFDTSLLFASLRDRQSLFSTSVDVLCLDLLASGQRSEFLKAKIDANASLWLTGHRGISRNVDHNIEEPIAARIARKVRAVLNFSIRQIARAEDPKHAPSKAEGIAYALNRSAFNRYPPKGFFAAVSQVGPLLLLPTLCVLLAHHVDRIREQAKLFTTADCQLIQIEAGQPLPPPFERIFLAVIAVIPDEINRPGLLV